MYEDILYLIYGNIDLYQDVDEKESFLLGCVGLFSLEENDFPKNIPPYSLFSESLKSMIFLIEAIEKNENFKEE